MDKNDEKIGWWRFSKSYLYMAKLGCQELLNDKSTSYKFDNGVLKLQYQPDDIFIAINYNAKHGIECFLKSIKLTYHDELERTDHHHDISTLFGFVRKTIMKDIKKIKDEIEKELNKNPDDIELQIAKRDADNFNSIFLSLESIVSKFYHCDVLKNKIENDFIIEDIKNDFFRFPDNSLKIKLNYPAVLSRISSSDIKDIYDDITILTERFNSLAFMIAIYKKIHSK